MEIGPGMLFEVQPGHDAVVLGDEACIIYDFAGMRTFGRPLVGSGQRVLATILCTDVVDSTATATRIGDAAWRDLIAEQTSATRREIDRYRGREAATTGDGLLALFDGAERAIHCAAAIHRVSADLDVPVRIGIHTGEIERLTDNVRGVAVHLVTRVTALAGAGETLVSDVTRELVAETSLRFESRGEQELKGIPRPIGVWKLLSE
jgi:class 3 adenylate cyclase